MKKFFWTLLILIAMVVAIAMTTLNPNSMLINFGFFETEIPISLALLGSMLFGALLGWVAGILPALGKGRQLKKTQKKLTSVEKEVENLRQPTTLEKP